MELNVTISVVVLLPVALVLVAGGLVLYRGSTRAVWRAAGMSSPALGVGTLLVFTLTLPVFYSGEGQAPEPEIVKQLVPELAAPDPQSLPEAAVPMDLRDAKLTGGQRLYRRPAPQPAPRAGGQEAYPWAG